MSSGLTRSRDHGVIRLYGQEPIKVSYHPARFRDHRHSGSGDMFLVFHVILIEELTSTCLISLIWVSSSRCTCLPNLMVICLMVMKIQFLNQFLREYLGKSWNHRSGPPYWEIFKIRNINLQFRSPRHSWQKNNNNNDNSKNNCKVPCASHKRKKEKLS